jgi:outer membrane cobalamin receptor
MGHVPSARRRREVTMSPFLLGLALSLAELTGTVHDPTGQPVAHATVVVTGVTAAPLVTHTDESGRFRLDNVPDGRFDITVSAPGLIGEARGVLVSAAGHPAVQITLRVSAITETLVVSASQIDQPLSRVADTVTVIDAAEIGARQLSFAGDALALVPGLTIARNGGPGTLTSVFPRGGESDFTLVLVDGIRANAFGGGVDLSQVPLGDVERIEVVRGPQSALYGSDAIGGVVQIITRSGGSPSATARVEGGSRGTRRAAGATTGELGGWKWQAGADYFADDGFTGIAPASGEQVSNDDAEERQAWAGGGYRWPRGTDVHGVFRYVDTDRGAPGPYGSDPADRFAGVDRISRGTTGRKSGGLRLVHPWGGASSRVRQRVEFDSADFDLLFKSAFNPLNPSRSETRRSHGRVQTDAVLDAGISVSAGLEWIREEASSTFITAGVAAVPVKRRVLGTFGEARWNGHERVTVQAGIRAEHIRRDPLAANPSAFSPRPAFTEDSIVSINPKVSAAWRVRGDARAWTRLRASAGTGIRPPDAFEIAFTDNPALKPERSTSVEAGVTQVFAGGLVTLDATTFFNEYDDLIISVGRLSDISRYRTDNISNARARGLELSAAWRGGASTHVRAAYTFLDAEIRAVDRTSQAPPPYQVGDRLLRRPTHQGSVDVSWTRDRITTFASLVARGVTLDAEPAFGPSGGLFENPARAVVDLGGSYRVLRGIEIYARVLNLFDKTYEEVLGFPAPGRTAFAGVRLAAGR